MCTLSKGNHVITGVLVEAMRKGHWIILDELNLAPTDVLEALNRVLDDNRELFIPETQETVKAHAHFMLFATQNPPGLYGGRKVCEALLLCELIPLGDFVYKIQVVVFWIES
jgi:midasin (ATPase involved in ribosome maturation)